MSRLWTGGSQVEKMILSDEGMLLGFIWLGIQHTILTIHNSWEVNQWPDGICREYFLVTTSTHLHLDLFRDCITNLWYVQRLHD